MADALSTSKFPSLGLSASNPVEAGALLLGGGTTKFIEATDSSTAALSGAATGRLRYNNLMAAWEVSIQGGAYTALGGGGGGPWMLTGSVIAPSNNTNRVRIGQFAGVASAIWDFVNQHAILTGEDPTGGGTIFTVQHAVDDATSQGEFTVYRSRGTIATPTTLLSGDSLARFAAVGWDGAVMRYVGGMDIQASNDWMGNTNGDIVFNTSFGAGHPSPLERFRIKNHPSVKNNIGYWSFKADGTTEVQIITMLNDNICYMADSNCAGATIFNDTILFGATSAVDVASKGNIRLPNNFNLVSKSVGGVLKTIIGILNDDRLYVADGNTNGVTIFNNDIVIGQGGVSHVQVKGDHLAFFGAAPVIQQTVGANVNNVVASGTTGQFDDFTNLVTYATDAPAIHATISQLCRSVAQLTVMARNYALGG